MASASPTQNKVKPSSARGLKKPASFRLRKDSRSERRQTFDGVKDLFFIFLGLGLRKWIIQESKLRYLGPRLQDAPGYFVSENLKIQSTASLVIGSTFASQAF